MSSQARTGRKQRYHKYEFIHILCSFSFTLLHLAWHQAGRWSRQRPAQQRQPSWVSPNVGKFCLATKTLNRASQVKLALRSLVNDLFLAALSFRWMIWRETGSIVPLRPIGQMEDSKQGRRSRIPARLIHPGCLFFSSRLRLQLWVPVMDWRTGGWYLNNPLLPLCGDQNFFAISWTLLLSFSV